MATPWCSQICKTDEAGLRLSETPEIKYNLNIFTRTENVLQSRETFHRSKKGAGAAQL